MSLELIVDNNIFVTFTMIICDLFRYLQVYSVSYSPIQ